MAVPEADAEWDVFISYAREEYQQARDLADALEQCTTAAGNRPRIFLDVSRNGTPVGTDWREYLEGTLSRCRFIVALYSQRYFSKDICQWELHRALELNAPGGNRLIPVLTEAAAKEAIPWVANKIHWLSVTRPTWFQELREALGLRAATARKRLRFETAVPDIVVNHTLPAIRVSIAGPDGAPVVGEGEFVTITPQPPDPGLSGTTTVRAAQGEAVFADLSFRAPLESVRLAAQAPGCDSDTTPPIQVRPPTPRPAATEHERTAVRTSGRPVFFPDGHTLAIHDGDLLTVHGPGRAPQPGSGRLRSRLRLWARGSRSLAAADWTGRVVLLAPDGSVRTADLEPPDATGLTVPGAMAFDGDTLHVGMWNGTIWSLSRSVEQPTVLARHPAGVQLLAVDGGRLLVGGLDGTLAVYENGLLQAEHPLEPLLLGMVCGPGYVLVIGEHRVHRLDLTTGRPLGVALPVAPLTETLPGTELSVALGAEGRGICFDAELGVHIGFHTVPGARPVCAAADGRLVVLECPDGSHVLMREGRISITSAHPLAVSPDGRLVAFSDGKRIVLLPPEELHKSAAPPAEEDGSP
ncbi:TIR domain-containing protein [Streptomyces sp. NPDC059009]|uniref:TIR domain-containing protein n=1 Tax=Streptomyces sp. NPDC059009 TaxID=3346694 RepID=UPI003683190F